MYRISYAWYALLGFLLSVLLGLAASLVLPPGQQQQAELSEDLFFPWVRERILMDRMKAEADKGEESVGLKETNREGGLAE